jgi:hypothetical protein
LTAVTSGRPVISVIGKFSIARNVWSWNRDIIAPHQQILVGKAKALRDAASGRSPTHK